ncbi:unnamed protein product [Kuraishia capsulata CBS 1993]|uniref:MOSC domain-containing protein n=1 Tax=Kuraishia capsulata CBS 1993 TaxID=1382522 RepID=W6MP78_9ASCO|nr:uncharacterized protein KUCA_T00004054001 [Kuraishia capsulata CBS 1993]CDK28073.1 unnamed protein product [Kuraishia capsulata CBS 1993]
MVGNLLNLGINIPHNHFGHGGKFLAISIPVLTLSGTFLVPLLMQKWYGIDDLELFLNTRQKSGLKRFFRRYYNMVTSLKASWFGRKILRYKPEYGGRVKELIIYPIKSISQGLHVKSWEISAHSVKYDRQYALVMRNPKLPDQWVVQNHLQQTKLGIVRIEFIRNEQSEELDGTFVFTYPLKHESGPDFVGKSFSLPAKVTPEYLRSVTGTDEENLPIRIWLKDMMTIDITAALPKDFAEELELPAETRLVYSLSGKSVDANAPPKLEDTAKRMTLFQDYYPALMITKEDVDDLQQKIRNAGSDFQISSSSFRANIVLEDTPRAFDTDMWYLFNIIHTDPETKEETKRLWRGSLKCMRCNIPNVSLKTGELDPKSVPTKLMSRYRRVDEGVPFISCFGIYVTQYDSGYTITAGDRVEIVQRKSQFVDDNPFVLPKGQKKKPGDWDLGDIPQN